MFSYFRIFARPYWLSIPNIQILIQFWICRHLVCVQSLQISKEICIHDMGNAKIQISRVPKSSWCYRLALYSSIVERWQNLRDGTDAGHCGCWCMPIAYIMKPCFKKTLPEKTGLVGLYVTGGLRHLSPFSFLFPGCELNGSAPPQAPSTMYLPKSKGANWVIDCGLDQILRKWASVSLC